MRYPVSFSQRRLWFIDQLEPGVATFNMPYMSWLDGPLDVSALQRAIDTLAERHAVLRTKLVAFDGVPEQVVSDTGTVPVERIDLPESLEESERVRQAEAIAAERGRQPFDLAAGPLIRVALIVVGPDRHLLSLVMHHSISDGVSLEVLFGDLSAAYRAETTGVPAALAPILMTYGDYAVWQQDLMRGEELDRQLGYWREQLRGAPQVLSLPTTRPRPARQSSRGAIAMTTVDAQITQRLAEVAHGENATMFMVFLTGFTATLSRYARQAELLIGTQVAGRTHAELDPMLGMFINTAVLRFSVADDPTFTRLLGRVRDTTLDAIAHQQLPFEKLVEELVADRDLGHAPLVQVQFLYGSLTPPELDLPGITVRTRPLLTDTAKLDLTMFADSHGEETNLVLEYSTDLFDPAWADRFLRCMARLLEHAANAPDTPVGDLPMLSEAEIEELILGRNRPAQPQADPIHDVRALLRESTSSVIDGAGSASMSQVCDRAARIAGTLAGLDVRTETLVGICTDRSAGMLAAMLGVWWAGGAYVPLDPGFPQARLAAMTRGADLRIVISDSANRELAEVIAPEAKVICVDDPALDAAPPLDPVPVPAGALAYVIFTSGSTGQPKGVGVEHKAVANLLASFRQDFKLSGADRFVAVTTLSFDIALLELLLPCVSGADLVIATAQETREPDRLRALIERTSATAMQATPQTWRLLISAGGIPAELRLRLCGGEALPPDLADQLVAPGVVVWNLYGPTETTVWSAAGVVASGNDATRIGPPIDHTRVYVLDERLQPVPVDVVGEVCLGGLGVARGYHDRPRLTARSFRPDPWSDEPGARLYRTGDLGRWRDGGGLELIGRNDHQVKIRGFRIECGEIEAVLRTHRDVRQSVVVPATRAGEPVLVGYIVPRRGSALAQPDAEVLEVLRPHLRAALPDYMVPALIVALPALPLTPNAKVDRAALPAPEFDGLAAAAGRVEARNDVEATVARIWGDLLAIDAPIGVHDNLFKLGAHSLSATRFVSRLADAYGVSLPVHHVFAGPTVAELAELVSADPDFGQVSTSSSRHADLDAMSDEDLEELLRAAMAQRSRRQANPGQH